MTIQERLHQALANQQAGKLDEAAAAYKEILRVDSAHPDALHLLGLIESKHGNHDQAVNLIQQAVSVVPSSPVMLSNLGVVLRFAGKIEAAIDAYRKSIALDPNNADAHFNLGKSLKLAGDLAAAEEQFRKAISLAPRRPSPWLSLISLYAERDSETALAIGQQAVTYCPQSSEVHMNLGAVYRRAGQMDNAIAYYRKAVELAPQKVDTLCRLASTLISTQNIDEGKKYLQQAQAIEPESVHVLNTLGLLHNTLGNSTAAVQAYRHAISLNPSYATAYSNLSSALRKLGSASESLECVQRSLELEPSNIESRVIEGGALMVLGRLEEAEESFRLAIEAKNGYRDAHESLLMCQHYQPKQSLATVYQSHIEWNERYAQGMEIEREFSSDALGDRPLRLGFVSADLGVHPVGYFTAKLFEELDRSQFTSVVYSDRIGQDPMAQRIQKSVDHWVESASLSDEKLYQQICGDQIDILFDLAGHTAQNRLMVFARRAAPVQISWAGYVGTTGVSTMDFLLADKYHVPFGVEDYYSERILRMPNGYVTYCPLDDQIPVAPLPAGSKGHVTFAAMCNPAKVNPGVLALWSRVLAEVPDSRLLLCYAGWPDQANRERVLRGLGREIDESRVEFDYRIGTAAILELYGQVDIALDTFPYSGGLTTVEALWMGVPTITWPGERFEGRHSLSHMSNVGLGEWVADSQDDYVAKAVALSSDLSRLDELRAGLRTRMAASPLCDGAQFARDFEQLMRQAWNESRTLVSP